MESHLLQVVGKVAGIGGIALGVFLLLFREVIRKNIFPRLPSEQAFKLIREFMYLTFSIAVLGIAAWVYTTKTANSPETKPSTSSEKASLPVLAGTVVRADNNEAVKQAEISVSGLKTTSDDSGNFYLVLDERISNQSNEPIKARVSKSGFSTGEWNVTPPASNLIFQLTPVKK